MLIQRSRATVDERVIKPLYSPSGLPSTNVVSWVRAIIFHPSGKYLLFVSDDKTLGCWDLGQGGKCVKVVGNVQEAFATCLRWAPGIVKESSMAAEAQNGEVGGGTPKRNGAERPPPEV